MSDIFISYAREDREKAKALADLFEQQGWSVWWDRNIPAGKSFDTIIEGQIAAAKCIVVLWSTHAVSSDWVKGEAGEAVVRQVLVPVRIDGAKVPLEFRRLQTVDLVGWDRGESHPEITTLLDAVSAHVKAPVKSIPRGPRWRPSPGLIVSIGVAVVLLAATIFLLARRNTEPLPPPTPSPTATMFPGPSATISATPAETPEAGTTEIRSTRNMRIEFWQENKLARMFVATHRGYPVVRVRLKQAPVEMRCDYYGSVAIQICAWSDDSIFGQIQNSMNIDDVPYFTPGTGMATTTTYSSLILNNRGHHYLIDERLTPLAGGRASFTFDGARNDYGTLAKWPSRVYLVAFSDMGVGGFVEAEDYERIILEFEN